MPEGFINFRHGINAARRSTEGVVAAAALALLASTSAYAAKEALTEEQIEGVQKAIKAMGCTVEDTAIEAEGKGYEADDVICNDGQYDVCLDKDYNVTNKVKED